jgi:CO/xanthine dehydrogenase Mo-binding subunit
MGITFRVDHERRRILATGEGQLTFEEVCDYADAIRPYRMVGYDELFDAAAVHATLTPDQIRTLAARAQQAPTPPAPWGVIAIVAKEPVVFGLSRMYATLAESAGLKVGVFYGLPEAEEWLRQGMRDKG